MSVLHTLAAGYQIGTGRLVPSVAALLGLSSVAIGGLGFARRAFGARTAGLVALLAGLISAAVGGVHAANAAGGLGTGNGLAGAVVAVALGSIGMILGGLLLAFGRDYAGSK